jgi:3-deoxy-7-phosphoheptulonate synthase
MNNNENLQRIRSEKPLPKPGSLITSLPLEAKLVKAISEARRSITRIIKGQDPRLLVLVGPCSLHEETAALDYAERLQKASERYADELFLVMRTYYSKPRTAEGWKGLIYDPFLDNSHDLEQGLFLSRKILLEINRRLPVACEFLDLFSPCYLQDLVSWCAIGARTTASQIHRELASGLPMPVGFKNSVDGNIQIAVQAAKVASSAHHYLGLNGQGEAAVIHTTGNEACHIILRGSLQSTNYSEAHIQSAVQELKAAGLEPRLMIDCSHGNCGKQHEQQAGVIETLCHYLRQGRQEGKPSPLFGVMLESHLVGGKQKLTQPETLTYGQSITDPCLSWEETEPLLEKLAQARRTR